MPSVSASVAESSLAGTKSSKPFSLSIGKGATVPTPKKRPHSTLADHSDSDDEDNTGPQLLSGFDRASGKAITEDPSTEPKGPLVIVKQKNRDWRAEAAKRKGKNLLPAEEQARRAGIRSAEQKDEVSEEKPTYGLLVTQTARDDERSHDTSASAVLKPEVRSKTEDEEALEALLGDGKKQSNLIIPKSSIADDPFAGRQSDSQTFKSDVRSRPDVPSLSDYAAVPIEEFGKALMRGMGWKEGEELGRAKGTAKPREVKRRPALLGIGAKEVPEGLEELGAWGKGAKKSRKIDTSYMPLVMQNAKTGEKLTEDELEKRRQNEKMLPEASEERRERRERDSDSRSERRHRHRHDADDRRSSTSGRHEREHDRSPSHRDRDRDRERRGHRNDREHDSYERRRSRDHGTRYADDDDAHRRRARDMRDRDRRDRDRERRR